jgi:hypothetical protein
MQTVTEGTSVFLGALVGAAAGLGGGGFAAIASLRASQLAARAPWVSFSTKLAMR